MPALEDPGESGAPLPPARRRGAAPPPPRSETLYIIIMIIIIIIIMMIINIMIIVIIIIMYTIILILILLLMMIVICLHRKLQTCCNTDSGPRDPNICLIALILDPEVLRPAGGPSDQHGRWRGGGGLGGLRGSHSSTTTCLTQVVFKSGESSGNV